MSSRVRVKCGAIELEYDGDLAFDKEDLLGLVEALSALPQSATVTSGSPSKSAASHVGQPNVGSVSDMARKLAVTTGPDLVLAAAATLHFAAGKAEFTTKELTNTMRDAKHFFKASYVSNLSKSLERLVKNGKLRLLGGDRYSLSNETIEELGKTLA